MRCKAHTVTDSVSCCWTETHIWGALIEFEESDARDAQIASVIDSLDTIINCPLEPDERALITDLLQSADPVMWKLHIAGPSEIERKRVLREIVRLFKPLS